MKQTALFYQWTFSRVIDNHLLSILQNKYELLYLKGRGEETVRGQERREGEREGEGKGGIEGKKRKSDL